MWLSVNVVMALVLRVSSEGRFDTLTAVDNGTPQENKDFYQLLSAFDHVTFPETMTTAIPTRWAPHRETWDVIATTGTECGSFEAVRHLVTISSRIKDFPSPLHEMGALASLHNSTTEFVSRTHMCGGVIISEQYVLTAAHCMVDGKNNISVCLGKENLDVDDPGCDSNSYHISETFIHPGYTGKGNNYNDIAILRLHRKIEYNERIWPFCLPEQGMVYENNDFLQIAGWGHVNKSSKSPVLEIAFVRHIKEEDCLYLWMNFAPEIYGDQILKMSYPHSFTDQILCAGRPGVNTCAGDSGGPMAYQNPTGMMTVVGLVSKGIRNCPEYPITPGFYTNVAHYVDWIYDTTRMHRRQLITNRDSSTMCSPSCTIGICLGPNTCGCSSAMTRDQCQKEFFLAVKEGKLAYVKNALSSNINTNGRYQGLTPLMIAAKQGHVSVLQALLDSRADLEQTLPGIGFRALHVAVQYDKAAAVRVLLRAGDNVNARIKNEGTALMLAAQFGHFGVAEALLEGCAIDLELVESVHECTALHFSARFNHPAIALLLLKKGADKTTLNNEGFTPATLAKHEGNDYVAKIIENY